MSTVRLANCHRLMQNFCFCFIHVIQNNKLMHAIQYVNAHVLPISLAVSEHFRSQCMMLHHSSGTVENFQSFTPVFVSIVTLTSHFCIHILAPVSIGQLICAFKAHFTRSASARTETPSLKYKKTFLHS